MLTTKLNILMIEDDPDDVDFYKTALDERGVSYTLDAFFHPEQALQHLTHTATLPHLIVLDLNLPVSKGPDVLALLKANEKFRDVPVMVLTGSTQPEDRELSMRLGARSFHTKPVHYEDLQAVADATLNTLSLNVAA